MSAHDERVLVVATAATTAAIIGLGAYIWYRTQLPYVDRSDDTQSRGDAPHRSRRRRSRQASSSGTSSLRNAEGNAYAEDLSTSRSRRSREILPSHHRASPGVPPPVDGALSPFSPAMTGGAGQEDVPPEDMPDLQLSGAAAAMLTKVAEDDEEYEPDSVTRPSVSPRVHPLPPLANTPQGRPRKQQPVPFLSPHSQQQNERQQQQQRQQQQASAPTDRPLPRAVLEAQAKARALAAASDRQPPKAVLEAQAKARAAAAAEAPARPLPRAVLEAQAKARADSDATGSVAASSESERQRSFSAGTAAKPPTVPATSSLSGGTTRVVKGGVNPAELAQASTALSAIYSNVGNPAGNRRKLPATARAERLADSEQPGQGAPRNRSDAALRLSSAATDSTGDSGAPSYSPASTPGGAAAAAAATVFPAGGYPIRQQPTRQAPALAIPHSSSTASSSMTSTSGDLNLRSASGGGLGRGDAVGSVSNSGHLPLRSNSGLRTSSIPTTLPVGSSSTAAGAPGEEMIERFPSGGAGASVSSPDGASSAGGGVDSQG
eukprot:CAMPEP_0206138458 /NCGR_PEP_ID=MMETSP1473-20131121/3342_1 /ASSEMBLY_ACC=CAM_ASM_001109 /TAXON_ID=1461547 /ORGANISM="Stichococcus sp, Strain RCC1054" /LENGTH=547 /DNA_ID=CAMNT_0053531903 /DNA_START=545 /DNA_END=2185 /DNA_ORIENTATION=-